MEQARVERTLSIRYQSRHYTAKNSQKVISKINLNITWVRVKQIIAAHENILIDEFALFLNFPPINIVAMAKSLTELELKQCNTNKLL